MSELKLPADSGGGSVSLKGPASTTSNADVPFVLPVADGSAGQYLKTDGSKNLGWSSDSGKILQVVKGAEITDQVSTTSTTFADTGTTVTITPSATSSKIWVIATGDSWIQSTGYNGYGELKLVRDSTNLFTVYQGFDSSNSSFGARIFNPHCLQVVDSPSTTSATTYKIQFRLGTTNYSATYYYPSNDTSTWYPNCQITAMEVAG